MAWPISLNVRKSQILDIALVLTAMWVAWSLGRDVVQKGPAYLKLEIAALMCAIFALLVLHHTKTGLYLFVTALPFLFYVPIKPGVTLHLLELLAIIFIGVWFIRILLAILLVKKPVLPHTGLLTPMFCVWIGHFVLLIHAPTDIEGIKYILRGMIYIGLFLGLSAAIQTPRDMRKIIVLMLGTASLTALLQWVLYFAFPSNRGYAEFIQWMVAAGFYPPIESRFVSELTLFDIPRIGANFDPRGGGYVVYLVPIILLAIALAWGDRRRRNLFYGLAFFLTIALLMTNSRTGVYGFGLSVLLMAYVARKQSRALSVVVIGALLLGLFLVFGPKHLVARLSGKTSDAASSSAGRIVYVLRSSRLIQASPLIGLGLTSLSKSRGGVNPHNAFLMAWQTRGIVAFLGLMWLYKVAFWQAWQLTRAFKRDTSPFLWSVSVWLTGGIGSYFLQSLATDPLDHPATAMLFYVMLGLLVGLQRICRSNYR